MKTTYLLEINHSKHAYRITVLEDSTAAIATVICSLKNEQGWTYSIYDNMAALMEVLVPLLTLEQDAPH